MLKVCFYTNLCTWTSHVCITLIIAHMHTLDHMQMEPESDVQEEQVLEVFEGPQASNFMDTNIFPKQGKPQCILPQSMNFLLN
jgi:hypothetical protein